MAGKIGILGSGVVARALGAGFLRYGYEVMLGTRDTSQLADWLNEQGKGAKAGTVDEAASFGEIVVLAVKGTAAAAVLRLAGSGNLKGKTVIDTTIPIADAPPVNGVLKFTTNLDRSLMEESQLSLPEAKFVKAFSCVGNALMVDPPFGTKPTMFICGNDSGAKKTVTGILDQFGWETADMGAMEAARAIEPLCMLWCIPGFLENSWMHAFKLLKV